jgi:hypothetical protein
MPCSDRPLISQSLPLRGLLVQILSLTVLLLLIPHNAQAQPHTNQDYCLPAGHIRLFLVDVTTEYDNTDKESIVGMINHVLTEAKGGDLIVIRTITESYTKSERLIERCIPQCPAAGLVNRLFECSDGLIRTDTIHVREDILKALRNRLTSFKELKYSDIIRTINADAQEEAREGKVLDLYMYSDLNENSEGLIPGRNFYRYPIPFLIKALKKFDLIAPLRKSDVEVAGVGRADTPDRRPLNVAELNFLREFWTTYFKAGGAANVNISQRATDE